MKTQVTRAIAPVGGPLFCMLKLLGCLLVAFGTVGCSVMHFDEARFERQRQLLGATWGQISWPDECQPVAGPPNNQPWASQARDHERRDERIREWWWCGGEGR